MKFFNSDKSGFLSFVAKRMKALFALLFIIAGTSSVWGQSFYVAGNGNGIRGNWCDGVDWSLTSSLMTQQGNIYVKQFANLPANNDYQFKIVQDGNWDSGSWGISNVYSYSDNTNMLSGTVNCTGVGEGNIKFSLSEEANVTIAFDFKNKRVAVYASSVEIGLIGSFINNWNLEQQIMGTTGDGVSYTWDLSSSDISLNTSDEFKFISGTSWDNNNNQWGGHIGGAYTIPASASTDGTIYNVDIVHHKDCGNVKFDAPLCPVTIQKIELNVLTNDLKITTGESSTEPDPVTPIADSYVVTWAEPVYDAEAGTVVLSATVTAAENAGFALADGTFEAQINVVGLASSERTILSETNQYTISHTISGVAANQQIDYSLQIVTGGGNPLVNTSDVQNLNPQTYTVPKAEPEPEPEPVSLYLIGEGTVAQWNLADALPFTYENGVYTWTGNLTKNDEAFKILTSNTDWEPAYVAETDRFEVVPGKAIDLYYREKLGDKQYTWDDNKFKITEDGEYTIKVTLGADNSGSMIVTKKSDPVYAATITADASASQETARQVVLTSSLTEKSASTDLSAATCQFQYKVAGAGEGTEYSNLDASVEYSTEGASLTTTALPQGGKYLFRAVWTLNGEVVATSEPSEATCVYPILPELEMFDVVWIPTYNTSDGSVTITAEISAKEDACFVMGQIAGLIANIFVGDTPQATSMSNPSGAENNKATATATIQNVNEGQELAYRLEFTTGASQQVLGRGGIQIPGGTYVVEAPEVHNSTVYLRGDINGWAYDGIDDKYIGKTYDDVNLFWDWSDSPEEFVTTGESGGSKFKFDDTTDGEWGDGQWNNGSSDAWIGEEQISDNKAVFTAIKGNSDELVGNFWILPNICPATISRIDLNVETNQLVITFDSYKKEFKDLWFRSPIVEGGWGDGISDPLGYGVNPKYQGQTSDGVVYVWDWSGSNAVTIDAGTNFKFGEYIGNASWGNTAYGGLEAEDRNFTSADFGNPLQTIAAAGYEFSPAEKVTITGVTLNTESMTVVFEGEAYVERFPVTVNTVNGDAGGAVVTEPADISNMAIGETVTVTATANEGYVALFEETSGVKMTDTSDNVKVFTITGANPVITVTFQVQCQTVKPDFTISGQFNVGVSVGGGLYEGTAVESGEPDPAKGYWSDGARFIQLTANNVPANYFEWECTTYAIDGVEKTIPDIAWKDKKKTSARAELSLPGTYTFVCKARCNETDDWTISKELTITAPAPEMGFNGNIVTNHAWGTPSWAGQRDGGYMQRVEGSLVWKSNGFTVDGFGDDEEYHFVVEQRYKLLGCVTNEGWTENNECGESGESGKDNKINRSDLSFTNVAFNGNTPGHNFIAINNSGWTSGVDGTKLQLVVTMTGYDSYKVELVEYKEECQNIPTGFGISAQLNAGEAFPWVGEVVVSGSSTETGGYFADDHRTVTLSTSQVADNYEWVCVQYAIDGTLQTVNIADVVTINNSDQRSATATLNLPGDYTFQCTAACTDGTPVNSATVTISTYPEMGFDGPIGTPASVSDNGWNHAWAGQSGNGLLVRENASLKWSLTFVYQGVGSTPNDFVVIQRYKRGCVTAPDGGEQGWAGFTECGAIVPGEPDLWGNKINASVIDLASGLGYATTTEGDNFRADDLAAEQGWVAGVTELTLTVTMTDWDSYTVELAKKQEQIKANYSSNDENMGTVTMKVGDTPIDNGADITAYIGQIVTLTATPAQGYKVASWEINVKVTESDRTTITPTLSGEGLNVVVTFERDCYSGVVYDLTGGGIICADGGSTELSLNTLNNVTYQLYKDGEVYVKAVPVQGNGAAAKWTISEAGTYTAKAYDSRFAECKEQAIDMKGSAVVTSVTAPKIKVNPGDNVHLTVLQARSFTADVPVDWSIRSLPADTGGDYCKGDGYMISSQTDTSLVAKFLCVGTAKITATMKDPNQNCMAEVTVHQNGAENELCAPEPEDMQ